MHGGRTETEQKPPKPDHQPIVRPAGDEEAEACGTDGDCQGQQGQSRLERPPEGHEVAEHGSKVGGPDRAAAHQPGQQQPEIPAGSGAAPDPGKEAHGKEGADDANNRGKTDETILVLNRNT